MKEWWKSKWCPLRRRVKAMTRHRKLSRFKNGERWLEWCVMKQSWSLYHSILDFEWSDENIFIKCVRVFFFPIFTANSWKQNSKTKNCLIGRDNHIIWYVIWRGWYDIVLWYYLFYWTSGLFPLENLLNRIQIFRSIAILFWSTHSEYQFTINLPSGV